MSKTTLGITSCFLTLILATAVQSQDLEKVAGRDLAGWSKDLSSPDTIVRLRAAKSLGPFGKSALDALRQGLEDGSPGVRYWSASHLGTLGEEADVAVSRLNELKDDEDSPAVQMAAAFALCRIEGTEGNVDLLFERLSYPERGMACSAAEFLGRLGPEQGVIALGPLERAFHANSRTKSSLQVKNPDYHVHGACQNALRQIKPDWKPTPPK